MYPEGSVFFSRSLFRSWEFLVATAAFVAIIPCSVAFYIAFWDRLPFLVKAILFVLICWDPIRTMRAAVQRHRQLRQAYFQGEVSSSPPEPIMDPALNVAAKAILDGLVCAFINSLALIFFLTLLLHRRF